LTPGEREEKREGKAGKRERAQTPAWEIFEPKRVHAVDRLICSAGLPGPKKLKGPNLVISSFKKGQILKNEKRPNKGQISLKKFIKITKIKFRIS